MDNKIKDSFDMFNRRFDRYRDQYKAAVEEWCAGRISQEAFVFWLRTIQDEAPSIVRSMMAKTNADIKQYIKDLS